VRFIQRNKSYVITVTVEFTILILSFLVYRLASENMTDFGFSEYTLSRRTVSLIQPLLMLGLGVGVPRYVSLYPKRKSILMTAIVLLFSGAAVLAAILLLNPNYFAHLFFGKAEYSAYIFPLFLLILGYCFHALLFGFLRGKHSVYLPNLIQFINIGILPIAVILFTSDVKLILYINGAVLILNSLILSIYLKFKNNIKLRLQLFLDDAKTLLKYGLPRVLGDFSLLLLITTPTYLVLYIQDDILISGDVAYSITLLNLVGAAFGPLGLVLLPEIANFLNKKNFKEIEKRFLNFILISMGMTLVGYLIYLKFSEEILKLLLGADYRSSINDLSLILLKGSFGYALYIVLRSFLDAIQVRATNAINLLVSLAFYAVLVAITYYLNGSVEDYLNVFVISVSFLGIITFVQAYRAVKGLK
jgi:O-antigen/teichoic acid export membrane protein